MASLNRLRPAATRRERGTRRHGHLPHANGPSIVLAVELERFAVLRTRPPQPPEARALWRSGRQAETPQQCGHRGQLPVGPQLAGARGLATLRAGRRTACGIATVASFPEALPAACDAGAAEAGRTRPTLARGRAPGRWSRSPLLAALLPAPTPRPRRWASPRPYCRHARLQLTEVGRRWGSCRSRRCGRGEFERPLKRKAGLTPAGRD